jgi:hypothetical protein
VNMAHRFYGTIEKTCDHCKRPFLAKTQRARYCDDRGCHAEREAEYKRRVKARKANG